MRRRNTARRRSPSPFVVMISMGLVVALVALVIWPKPKSDKTSTKEKTRTAIHSTKGQTAPTAQAPAPVAQVSTKAVKIFSGKVRGPLPHSMRAKLGRENARFLSALAARLLIWKLDLRRDLRRGDHIRVLYRPVNNQSKFQILAMKYTSLKHGKTFSYYRYHEAGKPFGAFYDQEGYNVELQLKNGPLRVYEQVTSILKMRRKHKGVDFKTPVGTKIYLPYRSRIVRRTWNFRYNGNSLEVEFLDGPGAGKRALFLHLQKLYPNAKPGRVLPAGTLVALTGNTGRSTAPHLHYQIQNHNARRIYDPYDVHGTYRQRLSDGELTRFQQHRRQLEQSIKANES